MNLRHMPHNDLVEYTNNLRQKLIDSHASYAENKRIGWLTDLKRGCEKGDWGTVIVLMEEMENFSFIK